MTGNWNSSSCSLLQVLGTFLIILHLWGPAVCCNSDGRSHVKCAERDWCLKTADEQRKHDPCLILRKLMVTVDTDSSSPTPVSQFLKKRNFPPGWPLGRGHFSAATFDLRLAPSLLCLVPGNYSEVGEFTSGAQPFPEQHKLGLSLPWWASFKGTEWISLLAQSYGLRLGTSCAADSTGIQRSARNSRGTRRVQGNSPLLGCVTSDNCPTRSKNCTNQQWWLLTQQQWLLSQRPQNHTWPPANILSPLLPGTELSLLPRGLALASSLFSCPFHSSLPGSLSISAEL